MILNLEPVFKNDNSHQAFDYEFALGQDDLNSSLPLSSVSVKGRVENRSGLVTLEARAVFKFSTSCARCLKQIERKITLPLKHSLATSLEEEESDEYILVENFALGLNDLVREDILLNFPSRFVCADDCKGLCTSCGADLNKTACKCKKAIDPRLAALAELLED